MGDDTSSESRHISAWINRSAADVYRYAADPAHLPEWAAGLSQGALTKVGDTWVAQSPMGEITIEFTPANDLGVLDHVVTMPSGEPVFNPLRVVPAGEQWSEVVFTLRRRAEMSDDDFLKDAAAITADLATLKRILERQTRG
ncbi:SRPBCC family protein [Mycobacterium sp. NBC_00419]|uniref:SRPBCC family protein n=1 Tax=Mycobacterium sp. NBC_00419 TaxID=2975989 RepID=UPI002E1D3221